MRSIKAINTDLNQVAAEVEKLFTRRAELETKIAGLKDTGTDISADELSMIAENNSSAIRDLEGQIADLDAATESLQERKVADVKCLQGHYLCKIYRRGLSLPGRKG